MAITHNPTSSKTGLIVTVNGTPFDVTTDPPLPQSAWATGDVGATLPALQLPEGLHVGVSPGAVFGAVEVQGTLTADGAVEVKGGLTADSGLSVTSPNTKWDSIHAVSTAPGNAAVSGTNTKGGFAFWGASDSTGGVGIFARGAKQAALFEGAVEVNGTLTADSAVEVKGGLTADSGLHVKGAFTVEQAATFGGAVTVNQATLTMTNIAGSCIQADCASDSPALSVRNGGTGPAIHVVRGTLNVDTDVVLTNADCAEDFDIAASTRIEPGTVMALDDGGSLRPSDQSYDKKVVGVISGAGEFRPAMILDRHESVEKRAPLALMGKVCCKVDAQYGSIEVGDLLTTSSTPGHAMKATDPARAFGAVIGKALRPLAEGEGQIPVLVALQ